MNIQGVIFTFSGMITIDWKAYGLDYPKILSFAWSDTNLSKLQNELFPKGTEAWIDMTHTFENECPIITEYLYLYLIFVLSWTFIILFHLIWTYVFMRNNGKYLQKLLIFIPSFYVINCLMDYLFWSACPWTGNSGENIRYLQIF